MTQYQPSASTLKEFLMKNWNLIQNQPLLRQIFKEPPIISYKKGKSLKDMLVRAKIWKVYTRFHPLHFLMLTSSRILFFAIHKGGPRNCHTSGSWSRMLNVQTRHKISILQRSRPPLWLGTSGYEMGRALFLWYGPPFQSQVGPLAFWWILFCGWMDHSN